MVIYFRLTMKDFIVATVQSWIKGGLRDFFHFPSINGLVHPCYYDNNQTIYVWFDALLGYVSALPEEAGQTNLQSAVASGSPASLHLIGKQTKITRCWNWRGNALKYTGQRLRRLPMPRHASIVCCSQRS
ncbi:hypothetical protein ACB098_07G114900 [Castanea mollissima]